ncbi:MAG: hypothetical protein WA799_07920 [Nitrosotalea sp.]
MVELGRYSKHDVDYQEFYHTQVTLAKDRISNFPLTNKLFDNFKNYENLNYKKSVNKTFLAYTKRISSFDPNILYNTDKNDPLLKPVMYLVDHYEYPYFVELLEKSLSSFNISQWSKKRYNSFKNRITSYDYSMSDSAFLEITTAFRIRLKIGLNNVQYEPSISNGKNSDIHVHLNGKEIYLELSSITESQASKKIQSIFDDVARYLFYKVKTNDLFRLQIWLDTTKLIHTDDNIDEEKSKKYLFDWLDKLNIHELVGWNGLLPISDYRHHSDILKYSKKSLIEYPWNGSFMKKLFQEQNVIGNWASKTMISDVISSPFVSIGCNDNVRISSVTIHENATHSTHEELVNANQFSDIQTGQKQEDSFLNQISRKILYKIKEEQYKRGTPVIFMIYAKLWSNSYETDSYDFSKIENIVKKALNSHPHVSGVLLYYTDYTNGKFIHNPNVDSNIKITDSELSLLFS